MRFVLNALLTRVGLTARRPELFNTCSTVLTVDSFYSKQASKSWEPSGDDWLSSKWSGFKSPRQLSRIRSTGVDVDVLRSIGEISRGLAYFLTVDGLA